MSGRLESDRLKEEKVERIIKDQPMIIREYANSFTNKTSSTKHVYICHVINFIKYINDNYKIDFNDFNSIGTLNYMHISSYINYIKTHNSDGTIHNKEDISCATIFYAIKNFCKFLLNCDILKNNPCANIEAPRDRKQHKVVSLTQEEINIIKGNIRFGVGNSRALNMQKKWRKRDMCIVMLGITTGLRVNAITNIDISDINFYEKTLITIEKGGYERTIYLSDKMISLIWDWIKDRRKIIGDTNCQALFISKHKKRLSVSSVRELIEKYSYNINKKITPHKLRSTAATRLYDKTGDIYLVADVLGHSNIQNTRRYASISDSKRRDAAKQLSELI